MKYSCVSNGSKRGFTMFITSLKPLARALGLPLALGPSKEFLCVEDVTEEFLLAAEKYEKAVPVNLGTGREITIKELVSLIMELTKYEGKILWDA